ncbi:MAG: HNH endonuclease signature motif containing protein [Candidatus Binatia bacterium]|nr:HNH endonuclease signature motif containing protein [Candidatus Binatia bacterium]
MMEDCIEWAGNKNSDGYGRYSQKLIHRLIWGKIYGPIPSQVLHSCDNPPCINIDHLFLGTQSDNMRDRAAKHRHPNSQKTHCKLGHLLDGIYDGHRFCRKCQREAGRRCDAKRGSQR